MSLLTPLRDWYRSFIPPISAYEQRDWLSNDDYWAGEMTSAGINVSRTSAMSLATVWRCVTLLTHAVSMLPINFTVVAGGKRFPEYTKPGWLEAPNPTDPTISGREHFAQVVTSLLLDGNAFVAVLPDVGTPNGLLVLDPMLVDVKRDKGGTPYYEVRNNTGQIVGTLSVYQMLHVPWIRLPGQLRGMSPLEAMRRSIGLGIVAEDFGSRFFGQGSTLSFGVEVPGVLSDDQRRQLTESLKARYSGTRNSHAIGVLTAGAKFVPGLQPTPEQAQFLSTRKFQVEEIARWFGVPPHLVGSQEPGASSYNSVEQRSLEFRQYGVQPITTRIEDVYTRILQVPDAFTSGSAAMEMKFNLDAIERADIQSRFSAYSSGIMAGVLKPNEARALEDLAPAPGGDLTYMQMQMVPVTQNPMIVPGAVTPPGTGATATPNVPRSEEPEPAETPEPSPTVALNVAEMVVRDERVIPAPEVRVEPTVVNVSPPEVHVDLRPVADALSAAFEQFTAAIRDQKPPEIPAPIVHVAAPVINIPRQKPVVRHVERDPATGNILRVREEPIP